MEKYEDIAIEAIKEYLINLLQNREWCKAKRIGKAFEILVEGRTEGNRRTIGEGPMCEEISNQELKSAR